MTGYFLRQVDVGLALWIGPFKTQCDTKKIENWLVLVGLIHWVGGNAFCEKAVKKTKSILECLRIEYKVRQWLQ